MKYFQDSGIWENEQWHFTTGYVIFKTAHTNGGNENGSTHQEKVEAALGLKQWIGRLMQMSLLWNESAGWDYRYLICFQLVSFTNNFLRNWPSEYVAVP